MDRQKLVDAIAAAPSGGASGTVGGATAEQVLLALEHAGYMVSDNKGKEDGGPTSYSGAGETTAPFKAFVGTYSPPKPGDG